MRRRAVAAGLLLGVCCFCAALAAIAPRQSAAAAASGRRHSSYTTRQQRRFREQQPDARRLQQESSGATITEARVLVVPRFPCQLVDANETVCMASMEAATSETCLSKAMTRATPTRPFLLHLCGALIQGSASAELGQQPAESLTRSNIC